MVSSGDDDDNFYDLDDNETVTVEEPQRTTAAASSVPSPNPTQELFQVLCYGVISAVLFFFSSQSADVN